MKLQSFGRELALVAVAGAIGWWAHGASTVVRAADSARGNGDDNLAFQFGGTGIEGGLTIYNRADHKLYVHPAAATNSHVNCAFSIRVEKPGAPLERQNCAPGSAY